MAQQWNCVACHYCCTSDSCRLSMIIDSCNTHNTEASTLTVTRMPTFGRPVIINSSHHQRTTAARGVYTWGGGPRLDKQMTAKASSLGSLAARAASSTSHRSCSSLSPSCRHTQLWVGIKDGDDDDDDCGIGDDVVGMRYLGVDGVSARTDNQGIHTTQCITTRTSNARNHSGFPLRTCRDSTGSIRTVGTSSNIRSSLAPTSPARSTAAAAATWRVTCWRVPSSSAAGAVSTMVNTSLPGRCS